MGETKVINVNYLIQYRVHSSTETYSLLVGCIAVIAMVLGGIGPRLLAGKKTGVSQQDGWGNHPDTGVHLSGGNLDRAKAGVEAAGARRREVERNRSL